MKIVYKINNVIVKLEEILIAAAVIIMSFMLIFNVVGRLFGKGINATEEIGLILHIYNNLYRAELRSHYRKTYQHVRTV